MEEVNRMEKKELLGIIAQHRTVKALDDILKDDQDYQEALAQQQECLDLLDDLELSAEQKKVVEKMITANNHTGAVYGAVAYRFGMEDGIRLCVEMEKITCLEQ